MVGHCHAFSRAQLAFLRFPPLMAALATETQDGASSPIPEVYVGTHGRSMQGVNRTSIGLFNIYIYIHPQLISFDYLNYIKYVGES